MARAISGVLLCLTFLISAFSVVLADANFESDQQNFAAELASLKKSLASKDLKESDLKSQLNQLQAEAKKLQNEAGQSSELKEKLEAVSKELGATKDNLSQTLSQLADKSSSSSATERKVAEATKQLEVARLERNAAKEKLTELETISQGAAQLQKEMEVERGQRAELQGEVTKLRDENSKLATELAESKKAAKTAKQDLAKWQSKAEKAEKNVEKAEKTLEKALQEHSATQSALIQAEAKAAEAIKNVESLLKSWLPHWLEQWYQKLLMSVEPALQHVRPTLDKAWTKSKVYFSLGKKHGVWAYGISKTKSQQAWKDARPKLESSWKEIKTQSHAYTKHAGKVAGPFLTKFKTQALKAYDSAHKQISQFLAKNRTVLKLRRNANQTLRELETLAIKYLKQVPFLKEYAKRPTITYIVYAVLAAPLITILVPLLTLKGNKTSSRARSQASKPSAVLPEPAVSEKGGKAGKAKKARRISVGDEHIRVP